MTDAFLRSIQEALDRNASIAELVEITRRSKERGLTQDVAYGALEALRPRVTPPQEDQLLELMDVVSGWCVPEHRLW